MWYTKSYRGDFIMYIYNTKTAFIVGREKIGKKETFLQVDFRLYNEEIITIYIHEDSQRVRNKVVFVGSYTTQQYNDLLHMGDVEKVPYSPYNQFFHCCQKYTDEYIADILKKAMILHHGI